MKTWKKRGLSLLLSLTLMTVLAACGEKPAETKAPESTTEAAAETTAEAPTEATTEATTEAVTEAPTKAAPVKPEKTGHVAADITGLLAHSKIWGRTMKEQGMLSLDWPASGVEFNAWFTGTELTVKCSVTSTSEAITVHVDGAEAGKTFLSPKEAELTVSLTEGYHNIRILKESITSDQRISLKAVEFDGAFMDTPEEKDLYIEVIGDSYACGSGSVGVFTFGKAWTKADHSTTHSFAWYLGEKLDADLSVVARGGIGVIKEGGGFNMRQIYRYNAGLRLRTEETTFKPTRTPDIVILELGANDGSAQQADYREGLKEMIGQIRELYGKEPWIVWAGRNAAQLESWKLVMKQLPEDTKLSFASYFFSGKGAAALSTQSAGHPDAAEAQVMADSIIKALEKNGVLTK